MIRINLLNDNKMAFLIFSKLLIEKKIKREIQHIRLWNSQQWKRAIVEGAAFLKEKLKDA